MRAHKENKSAVTLNCPNTPGNQELKNCHYAIFHLPFFLGNFHFLGVDGEFTFHPFLEATPQGKLRVKDTSKLNVLTKFLLRKDRIEYVQRRLVGSYITLMITRFTQGYLLALVWPVFELLLILLLRPWPYSFVPFHVHPSFDTKHKLF